MLDALKFVQGAIQRNGLTPELEHFQIKDGTVIGFNGYMALSSPIALDIEARPKAALFHKALQTCGDSISLTLTAAGRLHIRSGGFSAYVPCIDGDVYEARPQGDMFSVPEGMATAFRRMLPFISEDASRPWSMGLAVGGGTYTATNNVILVQLWDGHTLPAFTCPRFAVAEVARFKQDPVSVQVHEASVTFHYGDGKWLRTQRLAEDWPVEMMNKIMSSEANPIPVNPQLFDAVDTLAPFATEGPSSPLYFNDGNISTGKPGAEEGAQVEVAGLVGGPAFRLKALQLIKDEVETIDFARHPKPCLFFGKNSRGALMGLNL